MRFKRLPLQDLQQLEAEFINFLASSGVTADDWEKLSKENQVQADELIDLFSDIVYEKVFTNVRYLDFRGQNIFKVFHLQDQEVKLIALELPSNVNIDFNDLEQFNTFFTSVPAGVKILSTTKNYVHNREDEVFEMMENGCCIIEKEMFQSILKLISA